MNEALDRELIRVQNLGDADFSYVDGPSPELDYVQHATAPELCALVCSSGAGQQQRYDPREHDHGVVPLEAIVLAHNEYLWEAYWEPMLDHAISVHYDYGFLAHIPEWARKRHAAQHAYSMAPGGYEDDGA